MREQARTRLLVVQADGQRAGIPLANVREIMRPLPIVAIGGAPGFVLGLAIIRGASLPVVGLGALLGLSEAPRTFGRFATLDVEGRSVALAVSTISGVAELEPQAFSELPPLLSHAASEVIETLGLHDAALLLVLRATRLVPSAHELHPEAAS